MVIISFAESFSWAGLAIVILALIRAYQTGANPGFDNMKRLGVFPPPPGWYASPSQGYPVALSSPVPITMPGWRETL